MGDAVQRPVLVVGTGRSGTTTTAQVLMELGVFMGWRFREFAEDLDFYEPNKMVLNGSIVLSTWQLVVSALIQIRFKKGKQWGFKDPQLCYLLGHYLGMLDDPIIIVCRRERENTKESFRRVFGWSEFEAEEITKEREVLLDRQLKGRKYHEIDFSREVPEEALKAHLEKILKNGG